MEDFEFVPVAGLKLSNCFLHGAGNEDLMGPEGIVEYVGPDYFILRPEREGESPMLILEKNYWAIDKDDLL
jgi:hypothetical protein